MSDLDLICCIDADTGEALLPLSEFAPLVEELEAVRAERDLLRATLDQIASLAARPAPDSSTPPDSSAGF